MKINILFRSMLFILISCLFCGCPSYKNETEIKQSHSGLRPSEDTLISRKPSSEDAGIKGSLAFYAPKRMREKMANNVSAIITCSDIEYALKELQSRIQEIQPSKTPEEITNGTEAYVIDVFKKMKIHLEYSPDDFEVVYKPQKEEQVFTTQNTLEWDWVIKPKKTGNKQLTLIVSGCNDVNGECLPLKAPLIFNIQVDVDPRTYVANLWDFLNEHPEWLFVQVLFPIVAYYAGKRQRKNLK
jgi:hypothetical protein